MNNIDLSGVESSLDAIANSQGNINSASSFLIAVLTSIVTFIACELLKYFLFEPHIRYKKVKEKTAYCIRPCLKNRGNCSNQQEGNGGKVKERQE